MRGVFGPRGGEFSLLFCALLWEGVVQLRLSWLTLFGGCRIEETDEARLGQMHRRVDLAFGSGQFVCMGRSIALIEAFKALAEVSPSL